MKVYILPPVRTRREMWMEGLKAKRKKKIIQKKETYLSFLNSRKWRSIRKQAIAFFKICSFCGIDKKLQVHHRTYIRLGGDEMIYDLALLCSECHKKLSFTNNLRKRTAEEQEIVFKKLSKFYPQEFRIYKIKFR